MHDYWCQSQRGNYFSRIAEIIWAENSSDVEDFIMILTLLGEKLYPRPFSPRATKEASNGVKNAPCRVALVSAGIKKTDTDEQERRSEEQSLRSGSGEETLISLYYCIYHAIAAE